MKPKESKNILILIEIVIPWFRILKSIIFIENKTRESRQIIKKHEHLRFFLRKILISVKP